MLVALILHILRDVFFHFSHYVLPFAICFFPTITPPNPSARSPHLELPDEALEVLRFRRALLHPGGGDAPARAAQGLRAALGVGGQLRVATDVVLRHPWGRPSRLRDVDPLDFSSLGKMQIVDTPFYKMHHFFSTTQVFVGHNVANPR